MDTPQRPKLLTNDGPKTVRTARKIIPIRPLRTPFQTNSSINLLERRAKSEFQVKNAARVRPPSTIKFRLQGLVVNRSITNNNNDSNINKNHSINNNRYKTNTEHPHHRTPSHKNRTGSEVHVNGKTYKLVEEIGSGGAAKVYKGVDLHTNHVFAIKITDMSGCDRRTRDSYFDEVVLLDKLRGTKNVVELHDSEYKKENEELIIVMEKGSMDLSEVIDRNLKKRDTDPMTFDHTFIRYHWKSILEAVNQIHKKAIVHADLKPVNFVSFAHEIKLIDFGIANQLDPDITSIVKDYRIGTINYMAPETLKSRAISSEENRPVIKYNSKADIWSLGCILYHMVYGRPPFDKYGKFKAQYITDSEHVINFPELDNIDLMNCLRSCLKYNPRDRPTAQELLNHPYLKGSNGGLR